MNVRNRGRQAPDDDAPVEHLIGIRLPATIRRMFTPAVYDCLRQCKPLGRRSVEEVAADSGVRSQFLYRRRAKLLREFEFHVLERFPARARHVLRVGRQLREEGGKLKEAERYLKRFIAALPALKVPDDTRESYLARARLELGHVLRDRGDENRRKHAVKAYCESRDAFLNLVRRSGGLWRDPKTTAGWLVAEHNVLQMNKIFAFYQPASKQRLYARAIRGYQRVLREIEAAPSKLRQSEERRAESQRLLGECIVLAGDLPQGLELLTTACQSDAGEPGDRVSRHMRRAEALMYSRRYDEAMADLEFANSRASDLIIERGIFSVLIGKLYCKWYIGVGDYGSLSSVADTVQRSARRLGLADQESKLKALLSGST